MFQAFALCESINHVNELVCNLPKQQHAIKFLLFHERD